MAAQSLASWTDNQPPFESRSCWRIVAQHLFTLIVIIGIAVLSACSTPTSIALSSATHEDTKTPTIRSIPGLTQTPAITQTLSPTVKPFGTPIERMTWPENGSLSQKVDIQINFGTSIDDLNPGSYIFYQDIDTKALNYVSFDGSISGSMFSFEPPYDVYTFSTGKISTRIVGRFDIGVTRYIVDLARQSVLKLDPLCSEFLSVPSPAGKWLAIICTVPTGDQEGKIEIEIVSLENGVGFHLIIPFREGRRYAGNQILWVSDDSFIAHIGLEEEPCLASISKQGIRCASQLEGKEIVDVSPLGTWLIMLRRDRFNPKYWSAKDIYSLGCFESEQICEPVVELENEIDLEGLFYWSPDETMLGVVSGAGLSSASTKVGYYDTETWTWNLLETFEGDYIFVDWCPDNLCMMVRKNGASSGHILYLDHRVEIFNDGLPIQIIEVP